MFVNTTAINAILAIIADSVQAIVVIYREAVKINYFLLHFTDSIYRKDLMCVVVRRRRPSSSSVVVVVHPYLLSSHVC